MYVVNPVSFAQEAKSFREKDHIKKH